MEDSSWLSCVCKDKQTSRFYVLNVNRRCAIMDTALQQQSFNSRETAAKRKRENFESKKCLFQIHRTEWNCGASLLHQLLVSAPDSHTGRTTALSGPFCLPVHTKIRTTGLLTGWGKVMRLLAAICGDRMAANNPDGRSLPLCVIFHLLA